MDSPERGALMFVRIFAAALICWAVVDVTLYCVVARHNDRPVQIVELIFKSLPFTAGIIVLIKSSALAEWISSFLDD